ncbi:SEL1-like repeat protein [Butyrivibrio sp. VCB2001]|uniref:SEL1-like repeat protein n=1 Tax=Butyrivibrio sp. VCB2001 TaxID=1280667 RepID=UPI0004029BC8|nr:tetratricopeptide repeat protein [Butyrivibrio sp. VCB2001]
MTIKEAENIVRSFDEGRKFTDEEEFMFIEALNFLIEERKDPRDMMYLGGYYYEKKHFDLALKYYEMAASMDYDEAYECLGYIWYYGRTGERDYGKAFEYFTKMMNKGNLVATYKVADMYRNGYYVDKDMDKYKSMIEDLYEKVQDCRNVFDPIPEVYTRLARIRTEEGKEEDAVNLYLKAKDWLAQRIHFNAFFGNLNIMKWLIDDLYKLIEFDEDYFDFFDLYYILNTPHKIRFFYENEEINLESVMEGDECVVCFNGKWYHSRDDFFKDAATKDGTKFTAIYGDLYGFEVMDNG